MAEATPGGGVMGRDWSDLQPELLELITRKINEIEDFVRFGAVCRAWRSSTVSTNLKPQVPWAVLPFDPNSSTRRFYSVSTNKVHTLQLPESRNHVLAGTAHGWLIMADFSRSLSLSLLNPLSRTQIHLPSITNSPNPNRWFRTAAAMQRFIKTYMFAVDRGDEFIVVVCCCFPLRISYCRREDAAWTTIPFQTTVSRIVALTHHMGRLYIMDSSMNVCVCDLGLGADDAMFVLIPSLRFPALPPEFSYYFATSSVGELLLITRHRGASESHAHFCFYKSDTSTNQPTWSRARGIGDNLTLFFSSNAAAYRDFVTFVDDDDASRCKKSCVYDFHNFESLLYRRIRIHYMDENEQVSEYIGREVMEFLEDAEFQPQPVSVMFNWMTPSLC